MCVLNEKRYRSLKTIANKNTQRLKDQQKSKEELIKKLQLNRQRIKIDTSKIITMPINNRQLSSAKSQLQIPDDQILAKSETEYTSATKSKRTQAFYPF